MKEPQVERFCSCIKKVKKTLKARKGSTPEQGAIAICTKSVLQSKGRTLKKLKCRDGILETQPMKGGVMIAMGADTPVFYHEGFITYKNLKYDDEDKAWVLNDYPVPVAGERDLFDTFIALRPVVRLVPAKGEEMAIHRTIKEWLGQGTGPYLDSYIKMHTNTFVGVYSVDIKRTYESVPAGQLKDQLGYVTVNGEDTEPWYGLLACHQRINIYGLPDESKVEPIKDILKTLLHIDGRFIHNDLHMGNAALMDDGTTVIHDFGRSKIRDYLQKHTNYKVSFPQRYNERVLRTNMLDFAANHDFHIRYGQFFYLARYFQKEFEKIADFDKWLDTSSYDPTKPENNRLKDRNSRMIAKETNTRINLYKIDNKLDYDEATKTERTVQFGSSAVDLYYLEPMYETRYHHLARIFDILSVLKPLHDCTANGAQFTQASRAAKELLTAIHVTPPTCSAEQVRAILLKYSLIVESTMEEDIAKADAYWKTTNDARNGGKSQEQRAAETITKVPPPSPAGGAVAEWDTDDGGPLLPELKSDESRRKKVVEYLKREAAEPVPDFKGRPEMADIAKATKPEELDVKDGINLGSGRRSFKKRLPRLV